MADKIDKREFTVTLSNDKDVVITTRMATNEELQDSEFEYSKVFNKAIIGGIVPRATLMAKLQENGIWGDGKDQAIEAQRQVVIALETKLADETIKEEDKQPVATALRAERDKLYALRQEKTELMAHCAEAKAEEVQRNFIVSQVSEYSSTGKRVWKNFDLFRKELDGGLVFRCTYEYLTFINGLPSDFINNLPENKVDETAPTVTSDKDTVTVIAGTPTEK